RRRGQRGRGEGVTRILKEPLMFARPWLYALIVLAILLPCFTRAQEPAKPVFPGASKAGYLLPNGWRLTPAGRQVPLTDLPLNIAVSEDGKLAFVATSGYNAHELTAVELATGKKADVASAAQSWFGLAHDPPSGRFWW